MKIIMVCLVCSLSLVTPQSEKLSSTIRSLYNLSPNGFYNYAFETSNGIFAEQQGSVEGENGQKSIGQFQYTSPEGGVVRLIYTADKDGFRPSGSHLPIAPETPPLILKSLEYLRSKGKL